MPGIGINGMGPPPRRYRLDGLADFELLPSARKEDGARGGLLAVRANTGNRHDRRALRTLSQKLLAAGRGEPVSTLASHVAWRKARRRILAHLWKVYDASGYRDRTTVAIIPRGWDCAAAELPTIDPIKLLEGLRSDLNRSGARTADGYACFFIHGEWHVSDQRFQLHVHGVVGGGMIEVVRRLRTRPKYRAGGDPGRLRVTRRVHLEQQPLANMPRPLTYIMKSAWHWSCEYEKNGKMIRRKQRNRMPEPAHSLALLWLDKHRFEDISLQIGMRPTRNGFRLTKSRGGVHQ